MTPSPARRVLRALALGTIAALLLAAPAAAKPALGTVDLIVRRDAGLSAAERAEVRVDAGVEFKRRLRLDDTEVVTVPADEADAALRKLQADPSVRWVQPDGEAREQAATTDPWFGQLWALRNTGQSVSGTPGTLDADMDVPEAWTQSTGAGVTVAVVDTGVDAAHPDLQGQLLTNPGEMGTDANGVPRASNGADDDGDGLVDDWRGYDFAYADNDPDDVDGHGTHVTGTVAAANGNGVGITGVAPDARVLALKALGDTGSGSWSDIANAFDYAGDIGVRIVNASLGAAAAVPVISDVIGQHPNTLYVVAAGNDGADLDTSTFYPCEAPQPNVLCVGASTSTDTRASFSNFSPTAVDVFAPGVRILSTTAGDYRYFQGTSMASPHVAGEAALLLARYPALSAVALKDAIMRSAEPKAALTSSGHNGGRANADRALALLADPADADADGVPDGIDNCPGLANADQADRDGDGTGDACDATPDGADADGDGVPALLDNCPAVSNPDQRDTDHDGTGDVCDATPRGPDGDHDGRPDMDDDCPAVWNPDQGDADHDSIGDACDATPRGPDHDSDGRPDMDDDCPALWNPDQGDADRDGAGDACDGSPRGGDRDGDGMADLDDVCPLTPGPATLGGCPPAVAVASGPAAPVRVTPAPPAKTAVTVKAVTIGRATCRVGRCMRQVDLAAAVSAGAHVTSVVAQARRCRGGTCAYRTVARGRTAGLRLAAGRYRVTVTASGPGGQARKTFGVTVRGR